MRFCNMTDEKSTHQRACQKAKTGGLTDAGEEGAARRSRAEYVAGP